GVVLVVLRIGTLMEALLRPAGGAIHAELIDLDQGLQLFDNFSDGAPLFRQSFAFATRRFELRAAPSPNYLAKHRSWQSIAVLMAGVLSTSLLGALLLLGTGERHRFAVLLAQRTRERNRIWQVSEDLLGVRNFEGYFISMNPAWSRTLGWSD